jgi:uncharacterized heparinase superfamily protein
LRFDLNMMSRRRMLVAIGGAGAVALIGGKVLVGGTAAAATGTPPMTRDQLKALWLHRAVAGRLVADPDGVMDRAVANLERLRTIHPDGMTAVWLDRWRAIFRQGAESVLETLTSVAPDAVELRQNSPFAGTLPEADRQAVLSAFGAWWRAERAA